MKYFLCVVILLLSPLSLATGVDGGLPALEVTKKGELIIDGEDFDYRTWNSGTPVDKVHVVQYFPGTMSASKTFEPFTDHLVASYELGTYHVTSIINLDAAMWGTSGFVESEAKKSKAKYPKSTLVLDKSGDAVKQWELGKKGVGLFILDNQGQIRFQVRNKMSESEQAEAIRVFDELHRQGSP